MTRGIYTDYTVCVCTPVSGLPEVPSDLTAFVGDTVVITCIYAEEDDYVDWFVIFGCFINLNYM